MRIERIIDGKKRFLALLLEADEQESMLDRYLQRGEMHAMFSAVGFYRACGFEYSHTVEHFFTRNYDHVIVDDGQVLDDMLYFSLALQA